MAIIPFDQISKIIINNPNKGLIADAKTYSDKLQMHVLGRNIDTYLNNYGYFESQSIYRERKQGAISNKDLFARLLQREEMVFNAQGGASFYEGLNPTQTVSFDATLDSIRFNTTIRKWIKEFALQAYRTDPMSLLFVEISKDGKKAYPTYKSISCIYDYQTNGRNVEYVAFKMTYQDCINFGVDDPTLKDVPMNQPTNYYRFVDDAFDYIIKNENGVVTSYSTLVNVFKIVPAVVSSDLIDFSNTSKFETPLKDVIELADTFFIDRSIRDLSKKYSGFPKAYEPLLDCGRCGGTGYLSGAACPECTPPGADKGTGYKLQTKVSDVARFPMDKDMPDPAKMFGYISPDVKVWDKQDTSLNDTENFMRDVYWGTYNRQSTTGPTSPKATIEETATKTLADLQPIYARLNLTADWAESTENAICDLIGKWMFAGFKKSVRTYGRYYILETPDELIEQYAELKAKGVAQTTLSDTLKKYYHSLYCDNKIKLTIMLKLMNVEPFIHYTLVQLQASNPDKPDYLAKMYYSEWLATKDDNYLLVSTTDALLADLYVYSGAKGNDPLIPVETVGVSETTRNTQ